MVVLEVTETLDWSVANRRIRLKTPFELETYEARFKDIHSGQTLVGVSHWRFTAVLELFQSLVVNAVWVLYAPEYILMSNIFDRAMNQE